MSQLIKCPNCDARSWSSDYWLCERCGYSESREWVLLEENKDYLDGGKTRGNESSLLLNAWKREQKILCRDMVNYLLPHHNLEPASFKQTKGDMRIHCLSRKQKKQGRPSQREIFSCWGFETFLF